MDATRWRKIQKVVETWHEIVAGERPSAEWAAGDDVVFYSPIAYTPQRDKAVTPMYLRRPPRRHPATLSTTRFTTRSRSSVGIVARLECGTTVVDKYVNGGDIIRCDNAGHIVELRVMIQPLQAINAVHDRMRAMLASMAPQLQPDGR